MGRVAAPYGVRGWVKVQPYTADPESLLAYRTWWVAEQAGAEPKPRRVLEGRLHAGQLVASIEGVDTREQAARYRGREVSVPRDALPDTGDDEVYVGDLVGLAVENRGGVALGRVVAVSDNGAQPVLRVVGGDDAERLIPFVPSVVDEVDFESARILVDWEAEY